jgi:hypothetical protein
MVVHGEVGTPVRAQLLSDRDPSGAVQTLAPSSDGKAVTVTNTTPLGLATLHARSVDTDGIHHDVTTPGGATSFGSIAPISAQTQITLPSGLGSVVTESRTVELSNLSDPPQPRAPSNRSGRQRPRVHERIRRRDAHARPALARRQNHHGGVRRQWARQRWSSAGALAHAL